jgi:hypothetical protein
MKTKTLAVSILLTFFLLSPITTTYAQTGTQYFESSFENESLSAPQRCGQGMYVPSGWTDADVGDGGSGTEMWYIDESDSRAPPAGFPDGSHGIYAIVTNDADWSTENFLMRIVPESFELSLTWYQMFEQLPSGTSDWLPIFWDYVRKVRVSDGTVVQFTVPFVKAILAGDQISISAATDSHVDLTGATTTPFTLDAMQWYKFEFWHLWNETDGKITFKINEQTVFDFTGDTVAKTLDQDTVFTTIRGFEVGMQFPILASSNNYTFWLDNIIAGYNVIPEFPAEMILPILILATLVVVVAVTRKKWLPKD